MNDLRQTMLQFFRPAWLYRGGAKEVKVEKLGTDSTTQTRVLMPDGKHGVEFAALVAGDLPAPLSSITAMTTVLSADFAIDAVAVVTITTAHGLSVTPNIEDVQLTVSESANGNVDDWAYGFVKVESVSSTNVVAKVNVTTASGTAGAKAKLNILVVCGV